jgi:hypothetical protein
MLEYAYYSAAELTPWSRVEKFPAILWNPKVLYDTINSMALVHERTIPTERPPPVGEVSANFCG